MKEREISMRLKKMMVSMGIAVPMFLISAVSALAATRASNVVINLPANQIWTGNYASARDYHTDHCVVKLISVYPLSGTDNFSKIQTRELDGDGDNIMLSGEKYYVLTEGAEKYTSIMLKENHLNDAEVYFQFCGNSNSAAQAVVNYSGY